MARNPHSVTLPGKWVNSATLKLENEVVAAQFSDPFDWV
jgi:hypothetical protein